MTNFLSKTLERIVSNDDDNSKELKRYGSSSVNDDGNSNRNVCPKKKCYRKFAVGYSTERHFRIGDDEKPGFYGAYGHVRKELDYTYHEHYRKERQFVQDGIIEDYLEAVEDNDPESASANQPPSMSSWLILTVGVKGAGKQHVCRELVDSGHLPLDTYVLVDMDDLRRQLPEYEWYLQHAPDVVGDMTRKEAGYIAETLCLAALRMGKTVVWDCALRDVDWYISRILDLKNTFPCLKVALMYVTATEEEVQERREKSSEFTGRTITMSDHEKTLRHLSSAVERVREEVDFDFWCHVENNDDVLEIKGDQDFEIFARLPSGCHRRRSSRLSILQFDGGDLSDNAGSRRTSFRVSRDVMKSLEDELSSVNRRPPRRRRFSCLQSSEENHKADDLKFYGRFAHIRKTLDYNYHSNYTFERQRFQDTIIVEFLNAAIIKDKDGELCTTPTEPWLCFTAGPMGAGKSYTKRHLVEKGRFPLLAFVNVDPDAIRRQLPEYHLYVEHNPELAGELTRKEAGFIAEILTLAGLESGKNVLVDGSLRDAEWYQQYFKRIRKEFPNVKIGIIQVSAPREAVFQRAADRAKTTGRIVPHHVLEKALEQVPKSVKILAPLADYHVELLNAPGAEDIEIVTESETWESFQSQWTQTCAWIPSKRSQANLRRKETELSVAESSTSVSTH